MKSLKIIFMLIALSFASCITAPFEPPIGILYSGIAAPLDLDYDQTLVSPRTGEAEAYSILGLVSWGDCSTTAAAEAAGIRKVHHADYTYFHVLGIYQVTTVRVHGE